MDKSKIENILIPISFFLIAIFSLRYIFSMGMLAVGDMSPLPETMNEAIWFLTTDWQTLTHGSVTFAVDVMRMTHIGLTFIAGGDAALAQKLYIMLPFFLALCSMYLFLGCFVQLKSVRYVVAFAYAFTHAAMANAIGSALGWVYGHALLPLLIFLLLNLMDPKKNHLQQIRNIAFFALVFNVAFATGWYILLLMIPFFLYSLAINIRHPKRELPIIFAFVVAAITILIANYNMLGVIANTAVSNFMGTSTSGLGLAYSFNSRLAPPILQIMTIQSIIGAGTFGWGTLPFIIMVSCLPLLAFGNLIYNKKKIAKSPLLQFFITLAICDILFIYIAHLRGPTIQWMFRVFRPLILLPNECVPMMFLMFLYSPLIAISLQKITFKHKFRKTIIIPLFLIVVVANSWIMVLGDFGMERLTEEYNTQYDIPVHYYEIADWLNERAEADSFFRTLWVPYTQSEVMIKIKYLDIRAANPPQRIESWGPSPLFDYEAQVFLGVFGGNSTNFGELLAPLCVKYIIVNKRSIYDTHLDTPVVGIGATGIAEVIVGHPMGILKVLNNQTDLKVVASTYDYTIYENDYYQPILSVEYGGVHNLTQINPSHYNISFNGGKGNATIILREPFDENWKVNASTGVPVQHSTYSIDGNVFSTHISEPTVVHVFYQREHSIIQLIIIFLTSMAILLASIVLTYLPLFKKR